MSQSDEQQSDKVEWNFKHKIQLGKDIYESKKKKRKEETLMLSSMRRINMRDQSDDVDTDLANSKDDKQTLSKSHHKRSKYSMKYHKHYSTNCASTPLKNVFVKLQSISSLSGIDAGSSSNGDVNNSTLQPKIQEKHKRTVENKKRANKIKQRKLQLENTDSEWETKSVESINEYLSPQKDSKANEISTCIHLFESLDTSERIRDAPIKFEEIGSPIIQSFRKSRPISKDINIAQQDHLLLPVYLPSVDRRNLFDTSEDNLTLHRETSNVKTYPRSRKSRKSPEVKLEHFMFSAKPLTLISDQLWNEFIEKHYGKTSHYYVPLSAQNSNMQESTSSVSKPSVFEKLEIDPILPGATVIRGYYNKDLEKWEHKVQINLKRDIQREKDGRGNLKRKKTKRKKETLTSLLSRRGRTDVYDQTSETDSDFKTDEEDNKRITFAKFRYKQKLKKMCVHAKVISLISSESNTE